MAEHMPHHRIESRLLFNNDAGTSLGRLTTAGFLKDSAGVGPAPRVLGHYALVYLLEGGGRYWDVRGRSSAVQAGDLLLITPELGHGYGPLAGERWSEFYVVFDGPAFDLWRQTGLLNGDAPVRRLEPIDAWLPRLEAAVAEQPRTLAERTVQLSHFLALLTEMLLPSTAAPRLADGPVWLAAACERLETALDQRIDPQGVARALGVPYETFRKQFQRYVGVSPARYRTVRRIDAACALLQDSRNTIQSVALRLGFADEYHFSRRFKQVNGLSPRAFRRQLPASREGTREGQALPEAGSSREDKALPSPSQV
jgi:AraC-like DNA-binding protein